MLTALSQDIVHGDVKCENVLIFEKDSDNAAQGLHGKCFSPYLY